MMKPPSKAELEKVKNYLLSGATKGGNASGVPYSPEYIDKLAAMANSKAKPKAKSKAPAAKGLLVAKEEAPLPSGLLTSPESEYTQDSAAPVTQEFINRASKGVAPLPSKVATLPGEPNIAAPRSKEVVETTKPDGTVTKKIKEKVEAPKAAPSNPANGDLIPADAMPANTKSEENKPKKDHNLESMGNLEASVKTPYFEPAGPKEIPDTMDYELPTENRFDPTPPPVPIVAQYPAAMPAIPPERFTNTEGLVPSENQASQGLDTTISALAPLPAAEMAAFEDLRNQRIAQIADAQQASADFLQSYQPRIDRSALLSFIGSQLGRDYLKGYQKPGGMAELVNIQDKLEENLARARTGLSDTQLQFLKARMQLQDKQKTTEEIRSILESPEFVKLKRAASVNQDLNQFNKRGAIVENRFREYDDQSSQNPGIGAKMDAYKTILESSVEIDKILARNNGDYPPPTSTDYDTLNTLISNQLVLVNRYRALLGALQGADERIVRTGMGVDESLMPNWVRSLAPEKKIGIAQAQSAFQQSMIDDIETMDSNITKKYEKGGEYMKTPELVEYHRSKKTETDSIVYRLLMNKPSLTPKQQETLFKVLSPEQRQRLREDAKKIKENKKSGSK